MQVRKLKSLMHFPTKNKNFFFRGSFCCARARSLAFFFLNLYLFHLVYYKRVKNLRNRYNNKQQLDVCNQINFLAGYR
jgi:hypothetical protein